MEQSTDVERDEPVSPVGRFLLQPLTNLDIYIAIAGEHPIDVDAFKTLIKNSIILQLPRFCSLIVRDSCGREHWRKTQVDIDRHIIIHHHPISDDISADDAVNDYISDLISVSKPLPTDKPLWEFHMLMAHKTIVLRVHHALGDATSLMSMLQSMCRRVEVPVVEPPSIAAAKRRRSSVWKVVRLVWYTLVFCFEYLLRVLWLKDKTTAVSGGYGVELWPRRLATARFRLDDMQTVKRAVADATINDVLIGVISNGLSSYLDTRSPKVLQEGTRMTGLGMVNLRPQKGLQDISHLILNGNLETWWGNKVGAHLLPVYFDRSGSDPLRFVKTAKATMDKRKLSLEAPFSRKSLSLIMSFSWAKLASICAYRIWCNTTFSISNVIGPREEIKLAGNPVKYIRVNTSSLPHAIMMLLVSYAGMAEMQILVAKDIVPDPKILAKCFQDALIQMKDAAEAPNPKAIV